MSAPWRLLIQNSSAKELPPLLISTTFTSNSYAVNITDLTYLWSESLDRRSIIKRSLDEDTSIDPSEDAEQMRVFLDKIKSALSGDVHTTLSLQAESSPESKEPPSLNLYVTVELPKGLQPLRWSFHLSLLPQYELSTQLTIPTLQAQNVRMKELEKLVDLLRDKDHVIQKLVDKLESTGAELGHVFAGATGKGGRKIPRQLAEERIRGLGVFKVEEWKKEMRLAEKENDREDIKVVVKEVYADDSSSLLGPVAYTGKPGSWLSWWENIEDDPVEISNNIEREMSQNRTRKAPKVQDKNAAAAKEDEDDFQVQATPPHLSMSSAKSTDPASSPPTLLSQAVIQDSTDDEEDLDAPSQRSIVPDSVPLSPPRQQSRKLGALGRSKPAPAPAPEAPITTKTPSPPSKTNGKHQILDDEETASEDEDDHLPAKSPPPPKPASSAPSEVKKGAGLGKIGGRAREATPPPVIARAASAAALAVAAVGEDENPMPEHKAKPKPKHKLGLIGHKAAIPALGLDHDDGMEESRGRRGGRGDMGVEALKRGETERVREEQQRETSLERADRKREELKRALEEKAKMPGRKKRKF